MRFRVMRLLLKKSLEIEEITKVNKKLCIGKAKEKINPHWDPAKKKEKEILSYQRIWQ